MANHPFGQVGSQREPARGKFTHAVLVESQRGHQPGHCRQQQVKLRHGIHDGLLIFLQVAVIGQRLCLQRRQEASEVTDKAAGLAAGKFRNVRILLLRHDGRAGRPRIIKGDVSVFRRAPIDNFFRKSGHVDGNLGQHECGFGGEVTSRSAIQGVLCGGIEAELFRNGFRIQLQGGAG